MPVSVVPVSCYHLIQIQVVGEYVPRAKMNVIFLQPVLPVTSLLGTEPLAEPVREPREPREPKLEDPEEEPERCVSNQFRKSIDQTHQKQQQKKYQWSLNLPLAMRD